MSNCEPFWNASCRLSIVKLTLLCMLLSCGSLYAVDPGDTAFDVSAVASKSPAPKIQLVWPVDTAAQAYTVQRKFPTDAVWSSSLTLSTPTTCTGYTDFDIVPGQTYEYFVRKTRNSPGSGALGDEPVIVSSGIEIPLIEDRGILLLLVDDTMLAPLATELLRLKQDLAGDGWTVKQLDVARWTGTTAEVATLKTRIKTEYDAAPERVKSVFLFGRIPVPYSGDTAFDGHGDHVGAWPTDNYYADMDGEWTDSTVNISGQDGTDRHTNRPGDGKFDQSIIPSPLELAIGRVDLSDMPAWAVPSSGGCPYPPYGGVAHASTCICANRTETELLRNYLDKDHNWRHKLFTAQNKALVEDNFYGGLFMSSPMSALSFLCGGANTHVVTNYSSTERQGTVSGYDYHFTLTGRWSSYDMTPYLWSYGAGGGNFQGAEGLSGVCNSSGQGGMLFSGQFRMWEHRTVFTMMYGSYFGDWDVSDNFLRAPLASGKYTLSNWWAAEKPLLHSLEVGDTLGRCLQLTNNDHFTNNIFSDFQGFSNAGRISDALMGDPTLRLRFISPASSLSAVSGSGTVDLTWSASPDAAEYYVYRSTEAYGSYTRISPDLVTETSWADTAAPAGTLYYMVRAVRLETTRGGTSWNASTGTFTSATVTTGSSLPTASIEAIDDQASKDGSDTGTLRISLSQPAGTGGIDVRLLFSGTVLNGTDIYTLPSTVSIPANATSIDLTVRGIDNAELEGDKALVVNIASGAGYQIGTPSSATVTLNDGNLPQVSCLPIAGLLENPSNPLRNGKFRVCRSKSGTLPLTVNLSWGGTATLAVDYETPPSSVVIPANATYADVVLIPIDDQEIEGEETVTLSIGSSPDYTIVGTNIQTAAVTDNDLPTVSITADSATMTEGGAGINVTLSLSALASRDVYVNLSWAGTATNGLDYNKYFSGNIYKGQMSTTFNIEPLADAITEPSGETVIISVYASQLIVGTPGSVTLTIQDPATGGTAPTIATQPQDKAVGTGETATFSMTADNATALQWQIMPLGQYTWTNIAGATSPTYTTPACANTDHGTKFRCIASNSYGSATSSEVTLSINAAPRITTEPADVTAAVGTRPWIGGQYAPGVVAAGVTPITYTWQEYNSSGDSWQNVAGVGSVTRFQMPSALISSDNGRLFRCQASNSYGTTNSRTVTLTVNLPPTISSQPLDTSAAVGIQASFSVAATGAGTLTYQWEISTDGTTWSSFLGAVSNRISLMPNILYNGRKFHCKVSNSSGTTVSNLATLTVTATNKSTPTVTWATPANITYGTALSGTQLNASASVPGTFTYTPALGNVPSSGNTQTLSVIFTPTDTDLYTTATKTVEINVLKKSLSVTADAKSRACGVANPAFTVTYAGFAGTDTAAVLGGTLSITCPATTTSAAGTYTITPADQTSSNYTISYVPGTLTVNRVALTIKANDKSRNVGVANPAFDATYTGLINGDTASSIGLTVSFACAADTASAAGSYQVTPSGAATTTSYTVTYQAGTLTVGKVAQNITFNTLAAKTYGDSPLALTASASSGLAVTYTSSNTAVATVAGSTLTIVGVGSTDITASQAGDATYGVATTVTQTLTVSGETPQTLYSLAVTSGSGSGSYTSNTIVPIAANVAPAGKIFDIWIGDTANIADANLAETTITMPAADATITATYKDITTPCTVNFLVIPEGSGTVKVSDSLNFTGSQTVQLTATSSDAGKYIFVCWRATGAAVIDKPYSAVTSVTFEGDASIIALFAIRSSVKSSVIQLDNKKANLESASVSSSMLPMTDGAPFTFVPSEDTLTVVIDGSAFEMSAATGNSRRSGTKQVYNFTSAKGVSPCVKLVLDLEKGYWSFSVSKADKLSNVIDNTDGVGVFLVVSKKDGVEGEFSAYGDNLPMVESTSWKFTTAANGASESETNSMSVGSAQGKYLSDKTRGNKDGFVARGTFDTSGLVFVSATDEVSISLDDVWKQTISKFDEAVVTKKKMITWKGVNDFDGSNVSIVIDLAKGLWSLKVSNGDLTGVTGFDGIAIGLSIGSFKGAATISPFQKTTLKHKN